MQDAGAIQRMKSKFRALEPLLDERLRRQWAATEATAYGWGGVQAVSQATGLSPNTIRKGQRELATRRKKPHAALPQRLRREGGGRKRKTVSDPELSEALEALVDPATRGDPELPLRWTCKSTYTLARELTKQGHPVSARTVGRLLRAAGYSLQGNRKTKEGGSHPDRNAQFEHINATVKRFQRRGQPVISAATKKKELVGILRTGGENGSRTERPKKFACMTSGTRNWARRFPMACTTSPTTKVGSAWASITTPPSSPPPPLVGGGKKWDVPAIVTPPNC